MKFTKTSDPEDLLRRINARLKEAIAKEKQERAERNKANAQASTGPQTPEGKQHSSSNSLKHGFYADVEKLDPRDSPVYQDELAGLRMGLEPDGPAEEKLIRDLAMLSARLLRLEAVEFALLAGNLDGDPTDARELAEAYRRAGPDLDRLHRSEVYLRRAFNRTLDTLHRMQKERNNMPLNESLKRTEVWLTYESKRTGNPHLMPARSMYIDAEGNPTQMNFSYDRPKPDAHPKKPASERTGSPQAESVVRDKGVDLPKEDPEAA